MLKILGLICMCVQIIENEKKKEKHNFFADIKTEYYHPMAKLEDFLSCILENRIDIGVLAGDYFCTVLSCHLCNADTTMQLNSHSHNHRVLFVA